MALALLALLLVGCGGAPTRDAAQADVTGRLALDYATQFEVTQRQDGTSLLTIGGTDEYLLVPKGAKASAADASDATVIELPLDDVYLAASSAMDFFCQIGALDAVRMTSTQAKDWSLPEVTEALGAGEMLYVGKYSTPDYELVLTEGAQVAIESTMIYHAPEVAERLAELGIPVLVERSSYEETPLGRMEWIKLYGLLTGRLEAAETFFDAQVRTLEGMADTTESAAPASADAAKDARASDTGRPVVAFFSLGANGQVIVRKPGDYVTQMIHMAGGRYFLDGTDVASEEANALSTMRMELEGFYEAARDADVIVYNSAIDAPLASVNDLVGKCDRLADFRAVREGNVWCTGKDLFQQPTCVAQMVVELNEVFCGKAGDGEGLEHLYKVS